MFLRDGHPGGAAEPRRASASSTRPLSCSPPAGSRPARSTPSPKRADRTSGAIYDHFGGKEGLLFALLEGWVDDVAGGDHRRAGRRRHPRRPPGRALAQRHPPAHRRRPLDPARARAVVATPPATSALASTWPAATRRRGRASTTPSPSGPSRRRPSRARPTRRRRRDRRAARPRDDAPHRPVRHRRPHRGRRPPRRRRRPDLHQETTPMTDDRPTLDGIDLLAATWGRGVPHDQFDRLRAEAPVYWHPEADDTGFWALTKHADVKAVSHDSATFSSELGGTFIPTADEEALASLRLTILNMDPPKHHRYRRLVSKGFTPRMITAARRGHRAARRRGDRRRVREGRGGVRRGDRRPGARADDLRDDRPRARGVAAHDHAVEPPHRRP